MKTWLVALSLALCASGCIYIPTQQPGPMPMMPGFNYGQQSNTAPTIVAFTAVPTSITAGSSATLTWAVVNASSVSIDQGIGSVALAGAQAVTPSATTNYTITATNSYGANSAVAQVVVSGQPGGYSQPPMYGQPTGAGLPVVTQFYANPTNIPPGGYSTLSWTTSGATSVTLQNIGTVQASGSQQVYPTVSTLYTLVATNSYGTTTATAQVYVGTSTYGSTGGSGSPVVEIFRARPDVIRYGDSTTLIWSVSGATSVYIQGIGSVGPTGSAPIHPYSTTNYIIAASNGYGTTNSNALVTVTESPYPPYPYTPPNYNPNPTPY